MEMGGIFSKNGVVLLIYNQVTESTRLSRSITNILKVFGVTRLRIEPPSPVLEASILPLSDQPVMLVNSNKYRHVFVTNIYYFKEFDLSGRTILFEDIKNDKYLQQIPFTGVPFIILGKKRYDCTHGVDRGISTKKKYKEEKLKKVSWST